MVCGNGGGMPKAADQNAAALQRQHLLSLFFGSGGSRQLWLDERGAAAVGLHQQAAVAAQVLLVVTNSCCRAILRVVRLLCEGESWQGRVLMRRRLQ